VLTSLLSIPLIMIPGFKLNIANRLRLGFGLLTALIVMIAFVGMSSVDKLHQGTNELASSAWPRIRQATIALDSARQCMNALGQLAAAPATEASAIGIERFKSKLVDVDRALELLEEMLTDPEARTLLADAKASRDNYVAVAMQVQQLIVAGRQEEARALAFGPATVALQAFASTLAKQVSVQEHQFDATAEQANTIFANAGLLVGGAEAVAILLALTAAVVITRSVLRPLNRAVEVASVIATGDLTGMIEVDRDDEAGRMMQALQTMNAALRDMVARVRFSSEGIAATAREIANGNLELSSRTEQQAGALEETASSMEEMASTVRQNAENALLANQLAGHASSIARKGGEVMEQVVGTMGDISDSSRRIVDIIAVIDGIAFQTNILALNASVEAARAGEQGRGFAVVAGEVRNLAQRSALAAKDIKDLIGDSVKKVDAGLQLVQQAGNTVEDVVASVQRVTDIMAEISSASVEQEGGISQVSQAIAEIDTVTQHNAALVEEASGAAASLNEQAGDLARMAALFKIDMAGESDKAAPSPLHAVTSQRLPARLPMT
jgi:methyl-accepting chemotaxis protein